MCTFGRYVQYLSMRNPYPNALMRYLADGDMAQMEPSKSLDGKRKVQNKTIAFKASTTIL